MLEVSGAQSLAPSAAPPGHGALLLTAAEHLPSPASEALNPGFDFSSDSR